MEVVTVAASPVELEYKQQAHVDHTCLTALLPVLHRLDRLLERAVRTMQPSVGSGIATSFHGLFVSREQVDHLLTQEPGQAQFQLVPDHAEEKSCAQADDSPLVWLIQSFNLSSFDADVVLIALAPEIDLRYERIYSYLQDDVTRKRPTVDLALNLLCSSADDKLSRRAHFSPTGPLIRQRLLQVVRDPNQVDPSSLAHYLKLDDQIRRLLLGQAGLDERLTSFCRLIEPSLAWNAVSLNADIKAAVSGLAKRAKSSQTALRLYFQGCGTEEKREAAEALAGVLGTNLLSVRIDRVPENSNSEWLWNLAVREAQLQRAVLFISDLDDFNGADASVRRRDLLDCVAAHNGITIFAGRGTWRPEAATFGIIPIDFDVLDFHERCERWESELSRSGFPINATDLEMLAGRFRLTALQITQAVTAARLNSDWRWARSGAPGESLSPSPSSSLSLEDLSASARSQCGHELATLATKIEPRYGWADLVLPPDPKAQLREICFQAEFRPIVYGKWGFDQKLSLGKGLNVLFTGAPGTGKTMGAEVIAHELSLDLYRIDLSQVVSKYIGETEKNLDRIFTAAENSNAILFFDEADALFGKRSEVRDSHDRYANIEISYLLQKMEEYQGISILATNLRQNLDEAFVRRLQAIVEFPFPDEEYRRRIWESVFPKEVPLGSDVKFDLLAREVRLAGGNIKNMALAAAFYAAADGGILRTAHLVQAARREHQKLARSWNPGELSKVVGAV
jgi:hypothetical protein